MCDISSKCHGHKRNKFWRTLWIFNLLPQLKALKQNIQEIAMNVMYTILTCRKENLQTPSTNKVSSHIMHYVMVDYFYSNDKLLRTMYRTSWTFNLHPHLKVLPQKLQIKLNLNADYWTGAEYHEPSNYFLSLELNLTRCNCISFWKFHHKKCSSQLLNNRKTHQPPHADKLAKAFKPRTDLQMKCLGHC